MLKKLKQRFILITLSLLSIVFLAALIGISIFQLQRLTSESYRLLEEMTGEPGGPRFRPRIDHAHSGGGQVVLPTFGVEVDPAGNILSSYVENVDISEEVLTTAISVA